MNNKYNENLKKYNKPELIKYGDLKKITEGPGGSYSGDTYGFVSHQPKTK